MAHPTSEERLVAEEEKLGRRLPESLRNRLLEENGGEVESDDRYSDSPEDSDWYLSGVADLVSNKKGRSWMGGGMADATEAEAGSWEDLWVVPEGTIVIASNGTADLLLLLPDDSYAFREHEEGEVEPVGVRLRPGEGEFQDRAA